MTEREARAQRHEQAIAQLNQARAEMEARTKDDEVRSIMAANAAREANLRTQLAAASEERDRSKEAHREALLRESAGRQELLARIAEVYAELEAMIRKYEPERIDEDGTIRPRLAEEPRGRQ